MMKYALLICRSQTEALALSRALLGAGVRGAIVRPPRKKVTSSCAYAVRIREQEVPTAMRRMEEKGFAPCEILSIER